MPGMRKVHADLVRAARQQPYLEDAEIGAALTHPHLRARREAPFAHADPALAACRDIFVQRVRDLEGGLGRQAFDDRRIDLLYPPLAQLLVHGRERAALLAHY